MGLVKRTTPIDGVVEAADTQVIGVATEASLRSAGKQPAVKVARLPGDGDVWS